MIDAARRGPILGGFTFYFEIACFPRRTIEAPCLLEVKHLYDCQRSLLVGEEVANAILYK